MQPYQTQNFALALTLATCGVPFTTKDGLSPILNVYSAELLRNKYGTRYRGLTLDEAAQRAYDDGNAGAVTYCFESTPQLAAILSAYNRQLEAIEKDSPTVELAAMEPEEAAALCAQLIHNRKKLLTAWKQAKPLISVRGQSRTETQGHKTVTVGSMKVYSLGASPETRSHLKV